MKKIVIFCLSVLTFAACQKVIPVDENPQDRQLVLNGVPSADKPLFVNLTYTRFFLDDNISKPVPDADITIWVNGTEYKPSQVDGCNFMFPYTAKADDQMQIRVVADGKTLEASTYVPRMPRLENLFSFIDTTQVFNCGIINFDINDYPDYPEYYSFTVQQRDSGARMNMFTQMLDTVDTVYNTFFLCMDPTTGVADPDLTSLDVSATEALGGYFYDRLLTRDLRIDGQRHNTTLTLMLLVDTTEVPPFKHEYTLHVESVTPERYEYLKSLTQAASVTTIFAEPAPIYSNIDGALGIFAGTAHKTVPLQMDTISFPPMSLPKGLSNGKALPQKPTLQRNAKSKKTKN